jgi:hypothetical protein
MAEAVILSRACGFEGSDGERLGQRGEQATCIRR